MGEHVRCVVWVGRLPTDPEHYWNGCAVALSCTPQNALDNDDRDHFLGAFDAGVYVPDGVGFYVWEGYVEWYDDRGSIPDGECGCRVWNQSWRPARPMEVWQAHVDAKKREVSDG